jgi:alkanesulfonate monooxygenase SsuD/methylene tetrahydromethanopterin reductase-like flavin-dependent oxidoreductase (luciferase family)
MKGHPGYMGDSIEWCVERRLPCAQVYQTTGQIEDTFNYYRSKAKEAGWEAATDKFILCRHTYIDETDQKARANIEAAMAYFFTVFNRGFNEALNKDAVSEICKRRC